MQKQEKMRKVVLGFVMVLVALVAFVAGAALHPNWISSPVTTTLTTTKNITYIQMGMGEFVLPIVDRNGFTGKNLNLSDFRGKVIVLDFMAPWCTPGCERMVSVMEDLYRQYANMSVVFIAVAQPWRPDFSHYKNVTITQFLSKYPSSLTYVIDSTAGRVAAIYYIRSWPVLFVLSKTGVITLRVDNEISSSNVGNVQKAIEDTLR